MQLTAKKSGATKGMCVASGAARPAYVRLYLSLGLHLINSAQQYCRYEKWMRNQESEGLRTWFVVVASNLVFSRGACFGPYFSRGCISYAR